MSPSWGTSPPCRKSQVSRSEIPADGARPRNAPALLMVEERLRKQVAVGVRMPEACRWMSWPLDPGHERASESR